jgi:hypothetical protein
MQMLTTKSQIAIRPGAAAITLPNRMLKTGWLLHFYCKKCLGNCPPELKLKKIKNEAIVADRFPLPIPDCSC